MPRLGGRHPRRPGGNPALSAGALGVQPPRTIACGQWPNPTGSSWARARATRIPEATAAFAAAHARPSRPGLPGAPRRDLRTPAPVWQTANVADPALVGHRLGGHGGGVRQHRRPGRRRGDRRQRAVRRAHVRRRRPLRGRGGAGRRALGPAPRPDEVLAAHPAPEAHRRRPRRDEHRRAQRHRRRSAPARATPCCWPTASPRSAASPSRSTTGGSTWPTAGTQKCLGVAPGLAPFTMNERATARRIPKPQSWYLDLGMLADYAVSGAARKYHHTAPVAMIMSLHAGLGVLLDEGLEASWARHAECGRPAARRAREAGARSCSPRRATGSPS